MTDFATWLYIVGYALVLLSVLIVGPVTRQAINKLEQGAIRLRAWEHYERRRQYMSIAHLEPEYLEKATWQFKAAHKKEIARRAQREAVNYSEGIQVGGFDTKSLKNAVTQVGRANVPTALLALLGGSLSTTASVISLSF